MKNIQRYVEMVERKESCGIENGGENKVKNATSEVSSRPIQGKINELLDSLTTNDTIIARTEV